MWKVLGLARNVKGGGGCCLGLKGTLGPPASPPIQGHFPCQIFWIFWTIKPNVSKLVRVQNSPVDLSVDFQLCHERLKLPCTDPTFSIFTQPNVIATQQLVNWKQLFSHDGAPTHAYQWKSPIYIEACSLFNQDFSMSLTPLFFFTEMLGFCL